MPSSASPGPARESLGRIAGLLARRGLRWYLFGAQAVILHGHPRTTADVDITLAAGEMPTEELLALFREAGFTSKFHFDADFIRRARVLPLIDGANGLPVDVVLAGPGLEEIFMNRVERVIVDGREIPLVKLEDLLAIKTLAGRGKDLDDLRALLQARRGDYRRAEVIATLRQLEAAIDSSDLVRQFEAIEQSAK